MHRDVGGDARQDLVAGDHHVRFRTPQAGVLRRMAVADDDAPAAPADLDRVALADAAERIGQLVDAVAEAAEARAVVLQELLGETRGAVEAHALARRLMPG